MILNDIFYVWADIDNSIEGVSRFFGVGELPRTYDFIFHFVSDICTQYTVQKDLDLT